MRDIGPANIVFDSPSSNMETDVQLLDNGWVYLKDRDSYLPPHKINEIQVKDD